MQVNKILFGNYKNLNTNLQPQQKMGYKNSQPTLVPTSYTNDVINFTASPQKLEKLVSKYNECNILIQKISSLNKILPIGSRNITPIIKKIDENEAISIVFDKTNAEQINLVLRQLIDGNSTGTTLSCVINKDGQMVRGVYDAKYRLKMIFERSDKNARKIKIDTPFTHEIFKPIGGTSDIWTGVRGKSKFMGTPNYPSGKNDTLKALFMDLTKLRASINV